MNAMSPLGKYATLLRPYSVRLLGPAHHPHAPRRADTFAKRRGQAYERWVAGELERRYGLQALSGLWFSFWNAGRLHAVQIDHLVVDVSRGRIWILETKFQHVPEAFWQMRNYYRPVLAAALGAASGPLWDIRLVEVCNWAEATPSPFAPLPWRIDELEDARGGDTFNVLVWRKPKR